MNIQDCKDINDYLQMCGVNSIDSLTKEQVFAWVKAEKTTIVTENSLWTVENGAYGCFPDEKKAVSLIKQAIKEGKSFYCSYVMNESYGQVEESDSDNHERFFMMIA